MSGENTNNCPLCRLCVLSWGRLCYGLDIVYSFFADKVSCAGSLLCCVGSEMQCGTFGRWSPVGDPLAHWGNCPLEGGSHEDPVKVVLK